MKKKLFWKVVVLVVIAVGLVPLFNSEVYAESPYGNYEQPKSPEPVWKKVIYKIFGDKRSFNVVPDVRNIPVSDDAKKPSKPLVPKTSSDNFKPVSNPVKNNVKNVPDKNDKKEINTLSRFEEVFSSIEETSKKLSNLANRIEGEIEKMSGRGLNVASEKSYILQARANLERVSTALVSAKSTLKLELINVDLNLKGDIKNAFPKTLVEIGFAKNSLKTARDNLDQVWSMITAKLQDEVE